MQAVVKRVLLTNDDGIAAHGLKVLEQIACQIAEEVWIVAPERDQSGTSHAISLHTPVRVTRHGERRYGVEGTPGDSAAIGVRFVMRDNPPDLILSGVNHGGNLGVETVFSGTVGAAMTGMLLGIPSIALSAAYTRGDHVHWETPLEHGPDTLRRLIGLPWADRACLNVNFPNLPPADVGPLMLTRQGQGLLYDIEVDERVDPRRREYQWLRLDRRPERDLEDTEAGAVAAGRISVTPLRFERTDQETYAALHGLLAPATAS